jgi:hypothetical protein
MPSKDYVTVRDWQRRSPLRLRATKKLDIHWCRIKCTRCPHMRGSDYALRQPVGAGRVAGYAATSGTSAPRAALKR